MDEMGLPAQNLQKTRKSRKKKWDVDMPEIYKEIDEGRSVQSIVEEMDIPRRSLYRCHDDYQKNVPEGQKRSSLTNGRRTKKIFDMDEVFRMLFDGKSVEAVAKKMGVSTRTIYRHAAMENKKN